MAEPEGQETPEEIRQALAELRGCMVLIHESDRPADQEQLEGAAKALSFLAPLEAELPALPADQVQGLPVQGPSVFQTVVPSSLPPAAPPSPAPPPRPRPDREKTAKCAGARPGDGRGATWRIARMLRHPSCRVHRICAPPSRSRQRRGHTARTLASHRVAGTRAHARMGEGKPRGPKARAAAGRQRGAGPSGSAGWGRTFDDRAGKGGPGCRAAFTHG